MAILKIARMGHPILRGAAEPVADPTAPEIRSLVDHMIETLTDADGVGLAAPQVHVARRVVIFHVPPHRLAGERYRDEGLSEDDDEVSMTALINPRIEPLDGAIELAWEGCLSVPGLSGEVPRHGRIRYRGLTPGGEEIDRVAEGFHARVVQHECDHLDGILFPMRMPDMSRFGFVEELRRAPLDGEGEGDSDSEGEDGGEGGDEGEGRREDPAEADG